MPYTNMPDGRMMIFQYLLSKLSIRRTSLYILLALVLLPSIVNALALTHVYSSEHFDVYAKPGDDVRGEYVADRAEEWFDVLTKRLGTPESGWSKVPIKVYPTHHDFVGSTGEEFGEKLVGRAYSSNQRIELDASEVYASMQKIIGHELTHIFIFRILGPQTSELPLWANEGIAKTESDEWSELDSQAIAEAAASGGLLTLSELAYDFPKGQADLSYAVSASMIRYISSQHNSEFVKPVLDRVAAGESFPRAVRNVTGKSLDDWEKEWRRSVMGRYAIYGWIRIIGVISGIVFPVLAVAAYFAIRRKQRRYLEQYNYEDGYDPAIDREYWPRE